MEIIRQTVWRINFSDIKTGEHKADSLVCFQHCTSVTSVKFRPWMKVSLFRLVFNQMCIISPSPFLLV